MDIPQQYLKALVEISQQINSIRHPDELLNNILDTAIQQLGAERGFILLNNEEGQIELRPRVVRNIDPELVSKVEEISRSTIQKVLQDARPLLTFDALSDERFDEAQSVIAQKIRSIACVPLILKGDILGVLYIDSRGQKARFSRQSLDFLQTFANQAAVALENVRLLNQLQQENAFLKEEFHRIYAFDEIVGKSKTMERVYQLMGKVLNNDTTVLISGETGTGKELIARAIHYNGMRKKRAFVPVNCGAIPENLIESELFGHKKGSFTGAISDKKGLVEMADSGTLFLDEIGELPQQMQVKLLRFLQNMQFTPVGEVKERKVDVRVIAATNCNLQASIKAGEFREDLFYRLNVINIQVPPLRERLKDIPLLLEHFLKKYSDKLGVARPKLSPEAVDLLQRYDWPGNIRELENTVERAVVISGGDLISPENLMLEVEAGEDRAIKAGRTLEELSKILLRKTLDAVDGNKTRAAEMMGVSLRWVHYKMKEWGLN